MNQISYFIHALSPLHVGTGHSIGAVDLPIARAKATHLPIVPGSSIKGVLRDMLDLEQSERNLLFGPRDLAETAHAGALAVGDAHLLLLPVRSFSGTMAYATCPFVLSQFARDTGLKLKAPSLSDNQALVTQITKLSIKNGQEDCVVVLEDLDLSAQNSEAADKWSEVIAQYVFKADSVWEELFKERFVILPDTTFGFLADTATEIRTRIAINSETRTVSPGALWTEENLPAESVLWGVMGVSASRAKADQRSAPEVSKLLPTGQVSLQIGGKHTVGRGLCRLIFAGE